MWSRNIHLGALVTKKKYVKEKKTQINRENALRKKKTNKTKRKDTKEYGYRIKTVKKRTESEYKNPSV